jgi:hypothetical protein
MALQVSVVQSSRDSVLRAKNGPHPKANLYLLIGRLKRAMPSNGCIIKLRTTPWKWLISLSLRQQHRAVHHSTLTLPDSSLYSWIKLTWRITISRYLGHSAQSKVPKLTAIAQVVLYPGFKRKVKWCSTYTFWRENKTKNVCCIVHSAFFLQSFLVKYDVISILVSRHNGTVQCPSVTIVILTTYSY